MDDREGTEVELRIGCLKSMVCLLVLVLALGILRGLCQTASCQKIWSKVSDREVEPRLLMVPQRLCSH